MPDTRARAVRFRAGPLRPTHQTALVRRVDGHAPRHEIPLRITDHRSRITHWLLFIVMAAGCAPLAAGSEEAEGTFSIIARDTASGELGMAVHSKAHAVGSRTISAKGGVAVIAHQA